MTVGFAAAAERVGLNPALYHLDSTAPDAPKVRPLEQEIARSLRGRAANPRWLAGQMRHGHRGAAEIAQSLDNLYAFAALTDLVRSAQTPMGLDPGGGRMWGQTARGVSGAARLRARTPYPSPSPARGEGGSRPSRSTFSARVN